MPNVSEIARGLTERRSELLRQLITPTALFGKSYKEKMLVELRQIEQELDIPSVSYNSNEFGTQGVE